MKRNEKFTGLTGVALRGFFARIRAEVIQKKVATITLREGGRVSPVHLIGWARKNGFVAEVIQNGDPEGVVRIGVPH
jgi:hypothetical protein